MAALPVLPEIDLSTPLRRAVGQAASAFESIDAAEREALAAGLVDIVAHLEGTPGWRRLTDGVQSSVLQHGYVVLRGLDADDGRSLLIVGSLLGNAFGTYGKRRVVKRFVMSPWTSELSHTLAAGNFHTDGNVSAMPPVATAMQCEIEDPGGDDYAELRVAHLPALLRELESRGAEGDAAISFLCHEDVSMAHGRSAVSWCGRLVSDGEIRYHPESLRVANVRTGGSADRLEAMIETIHTAALAVSIPFRTRPGDVLLVSNRRALHYRGACSVRFRHFPTEYDSRSLLVLHREGPHA